MVILLSSTLSGLIPTKSEAATTPNFNLQFADNKGSAINGTYNGNKFTLKKQSGSVDQSGNGIGIWDYTPSGSNAVVCSGSLLTISGIVAAKGAAGQASTSASQFAYNPTTSSGCTAYGDQSIPVKSFSGGAAGSGSIDWGGAKGVVGPQGQDLVVTFSDKSTYTFVDNNTADTTYNWKASSQTGVSIGGTKIASWCPNSVTGTGDDSHGISITSLTDTTAKVVMSYNNGSGSCTTDNTTIAIDASAFAATLANGDGRTTPSACEANSGGWSFTWAVCPVLDAANGLTTALVDTFEDQLSFNVSQLGTSTDPNSGNYKIHQSWSIVKDIASALVVIVMLVMVLSQAASFGPFDAYTIRKLLPKLIAAVILMQISWPLFNFVITVVNDLANGLANIMYLPFGGTKNMDLWHLLANAKLSNGLLSAMDWGALIVFVALGVAFLFTMLGMALTAVIALFFAVITLVFRKILIILLLIFAPLALLAWILPGTKKYWDMWWTNFIKVLFMFPLIVVIIAAGRIFAYVVGSQDNGQFLNLIFIMVGFFGPLFLLPKTFKWGGQAMQLAGNGIMKASSKVSERPKKYFDKRQEELAHQKQISAARRTRNWEKLSNSQKLGSIIRGDKFRSGEWDPAYSLTPPGLGRKEMLRQRQEKYSRFRGQAVRSENEERDFAKESMLEDATLANPGNEGEYFTKIINSEMVKAPEKRNHIELEAAFDLLTERGGDADVAYIGRQMETLYNSDKEADRQFGAQLAQRKADKLFGKLPFNPYYKGFTGWGSSAKAAEFATISENGLDHTIDELQKTISSGGDAGAKAQVALNNIYSEFSRALTSPSISPNISPGMRAKVAERLENTNTPEAEQVREALNATSAAAVVAGVGGRVATPTGGNVTPITTTTPGPAPQPGELNVPHPTPTGPVQAADLDTRGPSGYTPREEAYVQNTRADYEAMRQRISMGETLTPEEQRRFEQIRGANPNW